MDLLIKNLTLNIIIDLIYTLMKTLNITSLDFINALSSRWELFFYRIKSQTNLIFTHEN